MKYHTFAIAANGWSRPGGGFTARGRGVLQRCSEEEATL